MVIMGQINNMIRKMFKHHFIIIAKGIKDNRHLIIMEKEDYRLHYMVRIWDNKHQFMGVREEECKLQTIMATKVYKHQTTMETKGFRLLIIMIIKHYRHQFNLVIEEKRWGDKLQIIMIIEKCKLCLLNQTVVKLKD